MNTPNSSTRAAEASSTPTRPVRPAVSATRTDGQTVADEIPLVAFERFMLRDDRVDFPMTFPARVAFTGKVDLSHWREALRRTLARHPLIDSVVVSRHGRLFWKRSAALSLAELEVESPEQLPRFLDITVQRGLRWCWRNTGERSGELWLVFHHAAVDGVGALTFVGDWLATYDRMTAPEHGTRLRRLAAERLFDRGRPSVSADAPAAPNDSRSEAGGLRDTIREVKRFLFRRVTPIAKGTPTAGGPRTTSAGEHSSASLPLVWQSLPAESAEQLRAVADHQGVTVNDLAMRELMLALHAWNREHGRPGRWYRITMPVNLRDRSQLKMPAANRIGFAFVDREVSQFSDPERLLQSLAQEHALIRGSGITAMFLATLDGAFRIPGAMRFLTRRGRVAATAVFSNVGDPSRRFVSKLPITNGRIQVGDLRLEQFAGAPPTRPGTAASFLLSQYAGEITLSAGFAPDVLGHADASAMLEHWRAGLLNAAKEGRGG